MELPADVLSLGRGSVTPRLRGLCRVVELVKVSCWAPGAEALLAI